MTTQIIILIVMLFSVSLYAILTKIKLVSLKTKVNSLINEIETPLRKGYYERNLTNSVKKGEIKVYVYVNELRKYTNGTSEIEIYKIGISKTVSTTNSQIKKFIKKEFSSLVKTSDIEWLEEEIDIKKTRKFKIENLKNKIEKK